MGDCNKIFKAVISALVLILLAMPFHDLRATESVSGQIIIKMLPGKSIGETISIIEGAVVDTIEGTNIYLISYPDSLAQSQVITQLTSDTCVDYVEANHIVEVPELEQSSQIMPDQNCPTFLSGQSPASYYGEPGYDAILADSAHAIATGDNILIGIIDNGIDFDHPLLANAIQNHGYDFVDNDTIAAEDSGAYYGHGTFVAGIIVRIAPDCKIVPIRAFNEDGYANIFDVTRAIYWAIDNNIRVLNMSFSIDTDNDVLEEAIEAAVDANICMAAAVGNDGISTTVYPGDYRGVIAVSAIDTLEYIADFSNYGSMVDVCAPGVNIYSSITGDYDWGIWSGTSFSTPMVAATCALLLELEPNIGSVRMMEIIENTADTVLQWGTITPHDNYYGYGKLNALEAVTEFFKGDVDFSYSIDGLDIEYMENYIYMNGPAPVPLPKVGDLDCSGSIDLEDMIILINYLNNGGPAPEPCE